MPKFTLAENDTPEIDPDALQVKLTGFGVDPDDLTKEPENVQLPDEDEHVTDDNVLAEDTENASTSSPDLEEIPLTQRNEPAVSAEEVEVVSTAVDEKDAEAEIQDIEAMLRGNRKTRAQKKAEKEAKAKLAEESVSTAPQGKRKKDIFVIGAGVAAVLLAGFFIAFFLGVFDSTHSIGMTMDEFKTAYGKTSAYAVIKDYGFAFPDVTYTDDSTDTTDKKAESSVSTYTGYVQNSLNYQLAITGTVNKDSQKINGMRVVFLLTSSSVFDQIRVVYSPYIQVLFPDMTVKESVEFLSALYTSKDPVTVKGNYALNLSTNTSDGTGYCTLYIVNKADASELTKTLESQTAAASATAAG